MIKKWDESHPEHKSYAESAERFLRTYKEFKPKIPHELIVVNCGAPEPDGMFDEIATGYARYDGGGYDCGTYQDVSNRLNCDLVFGLNTHTYFWRYGWLEPFVDAFKVCGHGIYGASASFENNPHIRTPAIAFTQRVMADYPLLIHSREGTVNFEAGPQNFSLFALSKGYRVCVVAADSNYCLESLDKIPNGFRIGDQSGVLVHDRHTDLYRDASPEERIALQNKALGRNGS